MTSATITPPKAATVAEGFLRPALFIPELRTRRKSAVLEELVHALAGSGITQHPEAILELLRQREALGSTGIGKGVAVPHARSTVITERVVLLARSKKGVEFEAVDGAPVNLIFLIVAPPVEPDPVYLKLLADIVHSIRLARVRQKLLDAPTFEAAREVLRAAAAA
ncbi:MAG TPA: PTS sugar transporter subunit IIA [Candidatus Eisenbacteria bacterium]|nr:PTS sugar transporter subunit IIA [Candidatus Eisenbacteria bacterium]